MNVTLHHLPAYDPTSSTLLSVACNACQIPCLHEEKWPPLGKRLKNDMLSCHTQLKGHLIKVMEDKLVSLGLK